MTEWCPKCNFPISDCRCNRINIDRKKLKNLFLGEIVIDFLNGLYNISPEEKLNIKHFIFISKIYLCPTCNKLLKKTYLKDGDIVYNCTGCVYSTRGLIKKDILPAQ
jgi:hypothetical protein